MIHYRIISSAAHIAGAMAMSKLKTQAALAGSAMSALGGGMGAVAAAAGAFGKHLPKPKPPGPKDWSPRRHGSCLCKVHHD